MPHLKLDILEGSTEIRGRAGAIYHIYCYLVLGGGVVESETDLLIYGGHSRLQSTPF